MTECRRLIKTRMRLKQIVMYNQVYLTSIKNRRLLYEIRVDTKKKSQVDRLPIVDIYS